MSNFAYMSGTGNDFIVSTYTGTTSEIQIISLVADADYEVDGVIFVEPLTESSVKMHYFNSDGSSAELCINGVRCTAKYALDNLLISSNNLTVVAPVGSLNVLINENIVTVDAPIPTFSEDKYIINDLQCTKSEVGNPHLLVEVKNVDSFNLKEFIVSAELIISDSIRPNCGHQHVEKLISDIHVTDIPYSLDITLEYIEGSIPENGIVGSAKCSFFDTSIPIALNNHSLLIGVPLLPSLDIGQPIKCNLRNKNHGEKTVHHLCKLQATEFILDVVGLAQYFSEPIKEITFFYLVNNTNINF